ncbi:hypothetical protein J25TS5_16870 [Paenibacillus faecis]|nr:hypothetical protein J25TS5_16870 [Paenibacillus faecis]
MSAVQSRWKGCLRTDFYHEGPGGLSAIAGNCRHCLSGPLRGLFAPLAGPLEGSR